MRKNITVEFTNERIIPSGGLAVVGAILGKNDFVKRCNRMKVDCNHPQHQIKNGDIMLTYIGMQCMGKPSFEAVHEMDDHPDFYKDALGICYAIPSSEPLRQRFDLIGSSIRRQVLDENIHMLKSNGIVPSKLPCGYVPVDMDVSPFDNSKTSKGGVSRTYKGCDGYAPMFAYIGREGYLANLEPLIIKRNLRKESKEDWLKMAEEHSLDISHPRDGKTVYIGSDWKGITYRTEDGTEKQATIRMGYEITERTMDKNGQFLLVSDIEVNTWWTNTDFTDRDVITHYHAHGECEQFHSELKTGMDLERLPSGKFETNELVLELAILSYNILRMIGQESLGRRNPRLKRRRHRTVINNLINMACHITEHARKLVIGLGKSNVWRDVFQHVYYAFEDFAL